MTHTAENPSKSKVSQTLPIGLIEIGVSGFKSFAEETKIQLGSLTILAGANSSGKSSIMQPLLLMKQTLEAPYDPGALLLDGANVSFTSGAQLISKLINSQKTPVFTVHLSTGDLTLRNSFKWHSEQGIDICKQTWKNEVRGNTVTLLPAMSTSDIIQEIQYLSPSFDASIPSYTERDRCFLYCTNDLGYVYTSHHPIFTRLLRSTIHVQGIREIPSRIYKTADVSGNMFIGQFENYVSSIINRFQQNSPKQLAKLIEALTKLGLSDRIETQRLNDTQIELRVGRVLGQNDTVNIADVGFGVSQVLPVIVALLVAQPGQLVYIEQPEIHLHPRAQIALAEIFADAASRGVRVVVETHSELFLLGIQTLVAEDKLDPSTVKLHWFTRNPDGSSRVTSAELDETGAFGDWPEDFGSTSLSLTNRYLSAAEAKLWSANGNGSHG